MKKLEHLLAEKLLNVSAIKLQPENPFTWASGWNSPIYTDNRRTLSYPEVRTFIKTELCRTIMENFPRPDVIAGVATGAIAQGALVADNMGLPYVYVRSTPKDHGLENLIEGNLTHGQKVLVIEDLVSTGKSSLKAVEAIRMAGGGHGSHVHLRFPGSRQGFQGSRREACDAQQLRCPPAGGSFHRIHWRERHRDSSAVAQGSRQLDAFTRQID